RNILNLVSGLRGYLLSNEAFFMQSYDSAVIENEEILSELSSLTTGNQSQKKLLDNIALLYDRWGQEFARPLLEAKKQAILSDSAATALIGSIVRNFLTAWRTKFSKTSRVSSGSLQMRNTHSAKTNVRP
ncbi:MAG TPA: CHASE3 domain-containing protein, partial [Saprospiraceae bacterium]|nr:CHASE3 domain-containing protein [Saprospiraceae bacterium]